MRSHSTPLFSQEYVKLKRAKRTKKRFIVCQIALLLFIGAIAYHQIRGYLRQPQAIFVLGGAIEREKFAAEFAQEHPDLPIWISSGSNPEYTEWVFQEAGIDPDRLHLDYQAIDTVTNFTTLVDEFQAHQIDSVYLITSDYHMPRARVIGGIVFWSRGIDFRAIAIPSDRPVESLDKVLRDGARSILWIFTGHTGSTLRERFGK
jgi:uncharacterized SAM-binding protein YcdF (DUF218 family)